LFIPTNKLNLSFIIVFVNIGALIMMLDTIEYIGKNKLSHPRHKADKKWRQSMRHLDHVSTETAVFYVGGRCNACFFAKALAALTPNPPRRRREQQYSPSLLGKYISIHLLPYIGSQDFGSSLPCFVNSKLYSFYNFFYIYLCRNLIVKSSDESQVQNSK
jgi:hypothetical protein